ncbi:MAG: S8 family serine peptidase [Acidobacteriota bacterium]
MFRFLRFFAGVAIAATLLSVPYFISDAGLNDQTVSVIVELQDEPAAVYKARAEKSGGSVSPEQLAGYRSQLSAKQDDFLQALSASGIEATAVTRGVQNFDGSLAATVPARYTLVFNGLALTVSDSAIGAIRNMPQVKGVYSDEKLTLNLNHSVSYIRAPQVYGASKELTQFDDLREGYEGQGMYVSVIDTGIDWTHPMFGQDPNPPRLAVQPATSAVNTNKKVVYSLPLTDLGVADGFGHGTHVAATAAGYQATTLDGVRLHGVAPQAKLMSYKVCSDIQSTVSQVVPIGGCDSSNIIMALEDSVSPTTLPTLQTPNGPLSNPATALFPKPVAHVINMSLGGSGGPNNPTARAASNASLMGAVVVAASGNSGPGEGTTGSPAAGTHVISVGATTHPGAANAIWSTDVLQASAFSSSTTGAITPAKQFPPEAGFSRLKLFPMAGTPAPPTNSMAQRYVLVTSPQSPAGFPASVRGRIALVKNTSGLPGGTFAQIANSAAAVGAVGLILISTTESPTAVTAPIPAANILPADGEILVDAMLANDNNNVDPPAGTLSELPIRMNPVFSSDFMGEMAGFSSRGPVRGLGQIKPDVSAPGVAVLAAVPPASLLGALAVAANPMTPNYIAIDGTSMASPHVAGAATLIKQAHLNWSPDMVRTVLTNTATNMRNNTGGSKAEGPASADSIIAQGGGLIDVQHAVNAKALMGVAGDGINMPGILGSHSYGEVPVVNNRITHTAPITVTIRDLSGQGGSYNLNVANNRDLQLAGITVSTSQGSVAVPANGSATFTVSATFDGDLIRDVMAAKTFGSQVIFEKIQMQWFVTATRSDNEESLRMPFFFRPGPSLPAQPIIQTLNQTATVAVGDVGNLLVSGVTYVDVPFNVSASTYKIDALIEWFSRPTGAVEDIDYLLLDPDGATIASSGGPAGASESVSVRVTRGGTYTHRLVGYTNVATPVTIATTLSKGPDAPTAQAFAGDFTDASGNQVDFDGSVTLNWTPTGGELSYEIDKLNDGDWEMIGTAAAGTTSFAVTNLADGTHSFRVRGLHAGQIGKYVTNGGNAVSVLVSHRSKVDITNLVTRAISNVSLTGGVFQFDLAMTNKSAQAYVPLVDLNIIGISSASGTVTVINADNGKSGLNLANAALFGYSQKIGSDQIFSPNEVSGTRTMRFQDNAFEMFNFDVVVTGYVSTGGGGDAGSQSAPAGGGSGDDAGPTGILTKFTSVIRFTANPLTQSVTAQTLSVNF